MKLTNLTQKHAEEILLLMWEAGEWFESTGCGDSFPESEALRKDIIEHLIASFPLLEQSLKDKNMKHIFDAANLYRENE